MSTGVLSPSEISFFTFRTAEDGPDYWLSSLSVVESLFKDEKITNNEKLSHQKISGFDGTLQVLHFNLGGFTFDREDEQNEETAYHRESFLFQLPVDILLRICGYVSPRDLAHLEQVCKKFGTLATENSLWKELYMTRWKLLELSKDELIGSTIEDDEEIDPDDDDDKESTQDEWAWIYSLLQQNERWKDIYRTRHSAEQWRIGTLKMFNGCWGFISQVPDEVLDNTSGDSPALDIFFHRKDICPDGPWYEDWWLQDTPGVSRSQKCGYWDTFLYGRKVRYKQRAAYAQGRRPQACQISFLEQERVSREIITEQSSGGNGMNNMSSNMGNSYNTNMRAIRQDQVGVMNTKPRHSPQKRVNSYVSGYPSSNSHSNYNFIRRRG